VVAVPECLHQVRNQPVDTQTTSAIYVGCVAEAALKASPAFSVSDMTHALEAGTIPCLGVQEKFSIPGLNVVAGQPAAVTRQVPRPPMAGGPYQGKLYGARALAAPGGVP